jgi:hypothetical protein
MKGIDAGMTTLRKSAVSFAPRTRGVDQCAVNADHALIGRNDTGQERSQENDEDLRGFVNTHCDDSVAE